MQVRQVGTCDRGEFSTRRCELTGSTRPRDKQLLAECVFDSSGFSAYLTCREPECEPGFFGWQVVGENESIDPQGQVVFAGKGKMNELFRISGRGCGDLYRQAGAS